jgi:hypothetical protein
MFPISHGDLIKWEKFLTKGGRFFQMDIDGHPPIPLVHKCFLHLGSFSTVFRVPNFWGRFEALNDVLLVQHNLVCFK